MGTGQNRRLLLGDHKLTCHVWSLLIQTLLGEWAAQDAQLTNMAWKDQEVIPLITLHPPKKHPETMVKCDWTYWHLGTDWMYLEASHPMVRRATGKAPWTNSLATGPTSRLDLFFWIAGLVHEWLTYLFTLNQRWPKKTACHNTFFQKHLENDGIE